MAQKNPCKTDFSTVNLSRQLTISVKLVYKKEASMENTARVLIVDDDPGNADYVARILGNFTTDIYTKEVEINNS